MDHPIWQLESSPSNDEKLEEVLRRRLVPYPGSPAGIAWSWKPYVDWHFLSIRKSFHSSSRRGEEEESRRSVFPSSVLRATKGSYGEIPSTEIFQWMGEGPRQGSVPQTRKAQSQALGKIHYVSLFIFIRTCSGAVKWVSGKELSSRITRGDAARKFTSEYLSEQGRLECLQPN